MVETFWEPGPESLLSLADQIRLLRPCDPLVPASAWDGVHFLKLSTATIGMVGFLFVFVYVFFYGRHFPYLAVQFDLWLAGGSAAVISLNTVAWLEKFRFSLSLSAYLNCLQVLKHKGLLGDKLYQPFIETGLSHNVFNICFHSCWGFCWLHLHSLISVTSEPVFWVWPWSTETLH